MSNLKHHVKRFFGTVALFLFLVVAVIWVYIFITNLRLAGVLKQVILPIIELIFMGAIGKLFWKKFQRYYRETQNFSSTLVRFIGDEWAILVSICVLILITGIHLGGKMPVYKVVVDIQQSPDYVSTDIPHAIPYELKISNLAKRSMPMTIKLQSVDQPFEVRLKMEDSGKLHSLKRPDTTKYRFESKRILRWNQGSIILKPKEFVKIIVRTDPESADAKVWIKKPSSDSVLCPDGVCTAEKSQAFKILVTADGYFRKETPFVGLEKDTPIDVQLEPKPGFVKFNITDEGKRPVTDMDVHIDGGKLTFTGYSSGQSITLTPGQHSVYMEKRRGKKMYYTGTLYFRIESDQTKVETCIVKTKPISP